MEKGLIHIYCGDGKGKTTAAMGLAIRAAGREKKVFITQFLKSGKSGELVSLDKLKEYITFLPGKPVNKFVWNMNDEEKSEAKKEHTARFKEIVEIIKTKEYRKSGLKKLYIFLILQHLNFDSTNSYLWGERQAR